MTNIQTGVRALAMTVLIGLGMVAPAMAQSPGFGFGREFDRRDNGFGFYPELGICLTDNQIRRAIADAGYSQISLNVPHNKRIQVRATKDNTVYLIKFNFCTGRIENRDALRAAQ